MAEPAYQFKEGPPTGRGSQVHLDEWVSPDIVDDHGFLRAGKILEWLDVVGVLAATRHCSLPVVTASVDGLILRDPIPLGSHVTLTAVVAHTSERSMGVAVTLRCSQPAGPRGDLLDAFMTFVAVDESGKPAPIPQLVPETPQQVQRFREGRLRRDFRKRLKAGIVDLASVEIATQKPLTREASLFIREFLKQLPRALKLPWESAEPQSQQGRERSYVHKVELVRQADLNFHGTLYGGTLMRWLESTGALSAKAFLGGRSVRLVGLHGLNFLRPIPPGRFVHIRSVTVHADARTLTTLINVESEDPVNGVSEETLRAFLTFVPFDGQRIPQVSCFDEEENAIYAEVEHRLSLQRLLELQSLPQVES